jgi:hypothetical protein
MRGYTVVASAVALGVDYKWLDNLLSHHTVPGVRQARQGVTRTVSHAALRVIALALELMASFQVPVPEALAWAARLTAGENPVRVGRLTLGIDAEELDRWLTERLAYAVEVAPVPRRGRPPRQG